VCRAAADISKKLIFMNVDLLSQLKENLKETSKVEEEGREIQQKEVNLENPLEEEVFVVSEKKEKGIETASVSGLDKIVDVNLIPSQYRFFPSFKKRRVITIVFSACLLAFVLDIGVFFVLDHFKRQELQTAKRLDFEIHDLESKLEVFENLRSETESLRFKMDFTELVLDQHIHWSEVLKFLENHTIPTVYYSKLVGSTSGVSLTAYALDFESLARQLLAFEKQDLVEEVNVSNINLVEIGQEKDEAVSLPATMVAFDVLISFKPEIYISSK